MQIRFVSWNLNGFAAREQGAFLAACDWDVCAVQEATTPEALDALATTVGARSFVSARSFLGDRPGSEPKYVSALLARPPWRLGEAGTLGVPSPRSYLKLWVFVASMPNWKRPNGVAGIA